MIDTQGTTDPADDVLVTRYHTGSMPALASNRVQPVFLDNNLLYIPAYDGGLSVIDTQGTTDPADDTLVAFYNSRSTPALGDNKVVQSIIADGYIYVSIGLSGLHVFDTKGTATSTDDVLVALYNTESTPAIVSPFIDKFILEDGLLYISDATGGLQIIDTKGTILQTDDTLTAYNVVNNAVAKGRTFNFIAHESNFFLATDGGLAVITPDEYHTPGTYISSPRRIDSTPTTTITIDTTVTDDHTIDLSYRTGSADVVWRDDFGTSDSYTLDPYGYGSDYNWQTATATDGVLRLSGEPIGSPNYALFGLSTGFPADHFAAGSGVNLRYRVLNRPTELMDIGVWSDEYESGDYYPVSFDDWQTLTIIPGEPFSDILIELYTYASTGVNLEDTTLEIDSLQITTADAMGQWGSWNLCPEQTCLLPDISASTYLQYKLDLETDNTNTTPVVHSVAYNGDYHPSGTYTSDTTTFSRPKTLDTFTPTNTVPASTTISYEYSLDEGSTWRSITPGADINQYATSFTWRATLTTTNPTVTPTIASVTLTHTAAPANGTATRVQQQVADTTERITALRSIDSPAARAVLEAQYPEYFNNPDAPLAKQKASIVLLKEVIRLLGEVAVLREETATPSVAE